MPKILASSIAPPKASEPAPVVVIKPPVSMEHKLSKALACVMRKMGLIGAVTPDDTRLLEIARSYVEHRPVLATDQGEVVHPPLTMEDLFKRREFQPNKELDQEIPF